LGVNRSSSICEDLWENQWQSGWTHHCCYQENEEKYVFSYKQGDGTCCLDRITSSGTQECWRRTWAKDWENFTIENRPEGIVLFSYKSSQIDEDLLTANGHKTLIKRFT